jgi:hypothetical protein
MAPVRSNSLSMGLAVVAAFGTYFCMYGFRKPFTAGEYKEILWFGLDEKTWLVSAQVLGYMVSKFIGIRMVSEITPGKRVRALLIQIALAELALVGLGLAPSSFRFVFLFFNGLMLGTIFGLVMGFLEGRRSTEALLAGLCTSFIIADGVMKSVGKFLTDQGITEGWMPAVAGLLFVVPLLISTTILSRVPPPTESDIEARSERAPMSSTERRAMLSKYGLGLGLIVLTYLGVTILRSLRADFAPEIWKGLGVVVDSQLYTQSEMAVALGIVVLNGSLVMIRNNRIAFFTGLALALLGLVISLASVQLLQSQTIEPFVFMVLIGLGLYLPYIAVQTTIFERFIAMTRERGTVGYLVYLADAFGYLGYVAVLFWRKSGQLSGDLLAFFLWACTIISLVCIVLLIPSLIYFRRLRTTHTTERNG